MSVKAWVIGKFYRRRWKGVAEYLGKTEQVPGINTLCGPDDFGCPVFFHRDLGEKYIHHPDGTMKAQSASPSKAERETCAPYDVME